MADDLALAQMSKAIGDIESGGHENPYTAEGPQTPGGDRAYGKYQIMGNNIPMWSEEAGLGRLSPMQFMADPDAQEKVFRHRMGKYLDLHNGSVKDAASLWHSGVPYQHAVNQGRRDSLGTQTKDYADHVAKAVGDYLSSADVGGAAAAPGAPPVVDPQRVWNDPKFWQLGAGDRLAVMQKVDPKFASLSPDDQSSVMQRFQPAGFAEPAAPTPSTRGPIDTITRGAGEQIEGHEQELDTAGRAINRALGQPEDHWSGQWMSRIGKNSVDAMRDFFDGVSKITHPDGFADAASSLMKMAHPIAVPGQTTTDMLWKAANDSGFAAEHPTIAALASVLGGLYVGGKVPLPGAGETPAMPLQGSKALRAGAEDAAAQAERAATYARATKVAGEEATTQAANEASGVAQRGAAWTAAQREESAAATGAAQAEATAARGEAEAAAAPTAPSAEATGRAREALTPSGATPAEAGASIGGALEERLTTLRAQTGAIYDTAVENAEASGKALDPKEYMSLSRNLALVRERLGGLPDSVETAVANLETKINQGQRVTASDLNGYKAALDQAFPGKMKAGTEVRRLLRTLFEGDDLEWVQMADQLWRDQLAGRGLSATSLATIVKLAKKADPGAIVEKLLGNGATDAQASMARAIKAHVPEKAEAVSEAFFNRLIRPDAEGKMDPADLLAAYDKLNPQFRSAITNPGAEQFFTIERQMQNEAARTAGVAKAAEGRAKDITKAGESAVKQAEQTAAKGAAEAGEQAAGVARTAAKETAQTERVAAGAQEAAGAAAEAAKAPNKMATLGANGLKIIGAGITAGIAEKLGIPIPGGIAAGAELLIPTKDIAKFLANNKAANLLARMLKTPANSAVVPTLLQQLHDSELAQDLFKTPEGQQKVEEARAQLGGAPDDRHRADGSLKGPGFLGTLQRPDGKVSTELSVGVNIDGKETEIPTLVPTLSKDEIDYLTKGGKPTKAIVDKAVAHAKQRMAQGLSPFKEGEFNAAAGQ